MARARERVAVIYHKRLEEIKHSGVGKAIIDHYNALSDIFDITVVSVVPPHKCSKRRVEGGFKFRYLAVCSHDVVRQLLLYPLRIFSILSSKLSPVLLAIQLARGEKLGRELRDMLGDHGFDRVVVEQPYVSINSLPGSCPITLRIHNIEYEYAEKLAELNRVKLPHALRELMFYAERKQCLEAGNVTALSFRDTLLARRLFGLRSICYAPPVLVARDGRRGFKETIQFDSLGKYVVYVASPHKPNIEAVKPLIKAAPRLREIGLTVVVAGGLGELLKPLGQRVNNVVFVGRLSEEELAQLYKKAYAAYVPHVHRSGLPIKLLEAIIYGVPPLVERKLIDVPPLLGLNETNSIVTERLTADSITDALRSSIGKYDSILRELQVLKELHSTENLLRLNAECIVGKRLRQPATNPLGYPQ